MRHFKRFLRNCSDSSEIGLIALIFENCFFAQLDAVFLLELLDDRFKELMFVHLLLEFRFDFHLDALFDASHIHSISSHLAEKLPRTDCSELKSFHVELAAKLDAFPFIVLL